MAAPEALSVPGDSTAAGPEVVVRAASQRMPQLIPIAQLVAVVLGVFAIIWHQQQTTDNLRTELMAEIGGVETGLGAEITSLRAEVAENGQRLARIEGFLGIGVPDVSPPSNP